MKVMKKNVNPPTRRIRAKTIKTATATARTIMMMRIAMKMMMMRIEMTTMTVHKRSAERKRGHEHVQTTTRPVSQDAQPVRQHTRRAQKKDKLERNQSANNGAAR